MVTKLGAMQILAYARVPADYPDFHTLASSSVDILLLWADTHKYRKPANANGSRARYFYAYLLRRARQQ